MGVQLREPFEDEDFGHLRVEPLFVEDAADFRGLGFRKEVASEGFVPEPRREEPDSVELEFVLALVPDEDRRREVVLRGAPRERELDGVEMIEREFVFEHVAGGVELFAVPLGVAHAEGAQAVALDAAVRRVEPNRKAPENVGERFSAGSVVVVVHGKAGIRV